jgi:hypothetical protein
MSESDPTIENNEPKNKEETAPTKVEIPEDVLKAAVEEQLKPIKGKLDAAFSQRDEALRKLAEKEAKDREAELKRLEEEGKHKEVYEMRLAEEKARNQALEKQNIELARDLELRTSLSTLPFRNDAASKMAYQELLGQLVRNEQGVWLHKSGASIAAAVKAFQENDENSFLFKPKANSGGNTTTVKPSDNSSKPKSVFEMSQEEVLKLAAEGKLPARQTRK